MEVTSEINIKFYRGFIEKMIEMLKRKLIGR